MADNDEKEMLVFFILVNGSRITDLSVWGMNVVVRRLRVMQVVGGGGLD